MTLKNKSYSQSGKKTCAPQPTPQKRVNVRKAIANVHASMAVEGLKPSRQAVDIGRRYLEGKITSQEAISRVKAHHLTGKSKPNE